MLPAQPICRYGIVLRPIHANDLEQVRLWRNAPHVRSKMEFQSEISPEMHAAWWASLDLSCNYYYIIEQGGKGIGVIHAKDINWQTGMAETGIFIGEERYLGTFVSVLAVLALMDVLFEDMGLQKLRAKVKADEEKVLAFNRQLGYRAKVGREGFMLLEVNARQYAEATVSLRSWAANLS